MTLTLTTTHAVTLRLTRLRGAAPVMDADEPDVVVLQESSEYAYALARPGHTLRHIEPAELFSPDAGGVSTGRLRTRLRVGRAPVTLTWQRNGTAATDTTHLTLDIHTRKLDYATHYRWMLGDIAQVLAEAAMHRFAASELRQMLDRERDAKTLYQRFVVLEAMVETTLDTSLRVIRRAPYVSWVERRERVDPRRGIRASGSVGRALSRPGPRIRTQHAVGRLNTIPRRVEVARTHPSVDNPPNRFVRFALDDWIALVDEVRAAVDQARQRGESGSIARGGESCDRLSALLRRERHAAWLDDVGRLSRFPAANTVLQQRAGYRGVFGVWLASELAGKLAWRDGDDVFGAGQRDVATLYEYWVYLTIARVVSELTDGAIHPAQCLSLTNDGLAVTLSAGSTTPIAGTLERHGRRLHLELFFNRTFGPTNGSWTLTMRPDCSLRVVPVDLSGDPNAGMWVHFDAKYRVKFSKSSSGTSTDACAEANSVASTEGMRLVDATDLEAELDAEADAGTGSAALPDGSPKRTDLVKMHAYRDAIGRSAGAFVVFPGTDDPDHRFERFAEILPGLGALALRPGESGQAQGEDVLCRFLDDVLDHAATQTSDRERAWWWRGQAYGEPRAFARDSRMSPPLPFLDRPPADAWVLLGWVRDEAHRSWALTQGLYNLRADANRAGSIGLGSRELAAEHVLLYGPGLDPVVRGVADQPRLLDGDALVEAGYPSQPGGRLYFVLPLAERAPDGIAAFWEWVDDSDLLGLVDELSAEDAPLGAPLVVSWQRLLEALA